MITRDEIGIEIPGFRGRIDDSSEDQTLRDCGPAPEGTMHLCLCPDDGTLIAKVHGLPSVTMDWRALVKLMLDRAKEELGD